MVSGRHWLTIDNPGSLQMAIVRINLTDHRYFVHFISVEFSEYNSDLVDFFHSSVTSTLLNFQTVDSIGWLDFRAFSQLDSVLKR